MKLKGIDVSYFQGDINYQQTANDIDFVIIREGYRKTVDKKFFEYVKGFQAAGVPIQGVYHFIYAMTNEDARLEAENCIKNVQAAGLPKSTYIWADLEYDTVEKAKKQGVTFTNAMINQFTTTFCETVKAAGYNTGIYTNGDYIVNHYTQDTLKKYDLWLADYSGNPDYTCLVQQYGDNGRVSGIADSVDVDYYYGDVLKKSEATSTQTSASATKAVTVNDALDLFRSWVGRKESDNSHRYIIDIYNSHKPLARGYAVQYNDQWCDTTISALFVALNAVDLIGGTECGVEEHVKLFKKAGIWIEDGTITPQPGDIIVFNWGQSTQPNDGYSDHIGMVESVSGRMITTIEGNYKDSVARRIIAVGNGYIRGYARPKYGTVSSGNKPQETPTVTPTPTPVPSAPIVPTVSGTTTTVRYGSTGIAVKTLQMSLSALGYTIDIDGEFGRNTRSTVMLFQTKYGLDSDGIVGPMTWGKIYSLLTDSIQTLNKTPRYVGEVTANSLNVRSYPSASYNKISAYPQLGKGNKVDVCAEVVSPAIENWLYIRIAGHIFGFVSAEYIKRV